MPLQTSMVLFFQWNTKGEFKVSWDKYILCTMTEIRLKKNLFYMKKNIFIVCLSFLVLDRRVYDELSLYVKYTCKMCSKGKNNNMGFGTTQSRVNNYPFKKIS